MLGSKLIRREDWFTSGKMKVRGRLSIISCTMGMALMCISCSALVAVTILGILGSGGLHIAMFGESIDRLLMPIEQPLLFISMGAIVIGVIIGGVRAIALAIGGAILVVSGFYTLPHGILHELSHSTAVNFVVPSEATFSLATFWAGVVVQFLSILLAHWKRLKGSS